MGLLYKKIFLIHPPFGITHINLLKPEIHHSDGIRKNLEFDIIGLAPGGEEYSGG